jgi:hypothetical protein
MLSYTSAQRLRLPGYAIMTMLIVSQLVDVTVRSSPFRLHSPAWRLGYLSATAGESNILLVALFLMSMIAAVAEDAIANYAIAAVSWVLSLVFLVAIVFFGLDVLQFRGQVPGALAEQYGRGSIWIGLRLAIAVGLLILLGVTALRIARTSHRSAGAGAPDGSYTTGTRGAAPKAARRA